jgi:hypothetical protein
LVLLALTTVLMTLGVQSALAATLDVGAGKTYATVQAAVTAAAAGDTVNVYPGIYSGGQFVTLDKQGLTIQGVNGGGDPITSASDVLATVGPFTGGEADRVFTVAANDVTITGIRVADQNNKAIGVNGDNFTLTRCLFENEWGQSGAIYFYDTTPGIKSDLIKSAQRSFTISQNIIRGPFGIAVTDGTGCGWPTSLRVISNNVFDLGPAGPATSGYAIGFRSVNNTGWCNSPVGGATITGNTFADIRPAGYVYFDGDVPAQGLSFMDVLTSNTFPLGAVMAFGPTGAPRTVLASDPLSRPTRPNLVVLSNDKDWALAQAQPGDTYYDAATGATSVFRPVTSTPASSSWSLAVAGVSALGVAIVSVRVQRRKVSVSA